MSLKRVDSWMLLCDNCGAEHESGEGWTLFPDHGYAIESAQGSEWLIRDGLDLCVMCWENNPYCRDENDECLRRDVSEADDGWLYCPEHIEQGMSEGSET